MFIDKDRKYYQEIISPDANLPVRIFFSNDQRPSYIPPHFHEDIEMIFLLSGSLTVSSGYERHTFLFLRFPPFLPGRFPWINRNRSAI